MSSEQRIYAHWKSLKHASPMKWVVDTDCSDGVCRVSGEEAWPHRHGHYEITTANTVWLTLARVHKMPVRAIKDIINRKRGKA